MERNIRAGLPVLGVGLFIGLLGLLFLLDRWLLTLSNSLVLTGLYLMLGSKKFLGFFVSPSRVISSCIYFFGVITIFFGWPFIGFFIELYGIYRLFGAFLPNVVSYVKVTPFSFVLDWPGIRHIVKRIDENRLPI